MDEQQQNQPAPQPSAPAPGGKQPNMGMAIVAYIIFFIPLLTDAKKDPFVRFHIRQGFGIFAAAVVLWIIKMIMPWYWLWNLYWLFNLINLAILVFAIIGIVNAANGKQEKLPLFGGFAESLAKMFKI